MLDIIELRKPVCDDDEDDDESIFNPSGYDELAQALRSVIWSNVDVNHGKNYGLYEFKIKLIVVLSSNQFHRTENLKFPM